MKRLFLFGHDDVEKLEIEAAEFDDVLVGDFDESFYNLTYKDSMLVTWNKNHCNALFIYKAEAENRFKWYLKNTLQAALSHLYRNIMKKGGEGVEENIQFFCIIQVI